MIIQWTVIVTEIVYGNTKNGDLIILINSVKNESLNILLWSRSSKESEPFRPQKVTKYLNRRRHNVTVLSKNKRFRYDIFSYHLVPVIAVCTIFVDASRIKLAQGMAQSSADLALNTVLTQYDEKLSDYYGLMASCQDVEEFYGVSQQYFVDCMVSQGISVTLAQEFAEDITEIVKGNATINDFIAIDQDKTSATIASPANANLANPVMMKEEVIEFMKYRAPIELVGELDGDKKGLVNKLTSVQDKIELMPTETKIEKEKNDYYVAESELMEKALEVYEALKEYEKFLPKDATAFDKTTWKTLYRRIWVHPVPKLLWKVCLRITGNYTENMYLTGQIPRTGQSLLR